MRLLSRLAWPFLGLYCNNQTPMRSRCVGISSVARAVSEQTKKVIAFRQGYCCAICNCTLPPTYQVDHILPLALGGSNGRKNLQALCRPCHTEKTRGQRLQVLHAADGKDGSDRGGALPLPVQAPRKTRSRPRKEQDADPPVATDGMAVAVPLPTVEAAASDAVVESGGSDGTEGAREAASAVGSAALTAAVTTSRRNADADRILRASPLRLLRNLNRQQLAAATTVDRHVRLEAGPGTGKTRVITARISYLVASGRAMPRRVLALTFTNRAARELRGRLLPLLGPRDAGRLTVGTFHSLCLAVLRREVEKLAPKLPYTRDFVVYDEAASAKAMRDALRDAGQAELGEEAARLRAKVSAFKNGLRTDAVGYAESDGADALVAKAWVLYEERMRERNAIDYDDMLLLTVTLFEMRPDTRREYGRLWSHVHVDEFQDTNSLQYKLLLFLCEQHANLFVVGDVDQSIYKWRGADEANIGRVTTDFELREPATRIEPLQSPPSAFESEAALQQHVQLICMPISESPARGTRLRLELNYRSHQGVLDAAMAVLSPLYEGRQAERLRLVAVANAGAPADQEGARPPPPVKVVKVEDDAHEAEYVVDSILRLQAAAPNASAAPSVAVIYRTNAQSVALERELLEQGVTYRLAAARSFMTRKEIRDALAYLRLIRADDDDALARIINVPPRRIGPATVAKLAEAAKASGCSMWHCVVDVASAYSSGDPLPGGLELSTAAASAISNFHGLIEGFRQEVANGVAKLPPPDESGGPALQLAGGQLLHNRLGVEGGDKDDKADGGDGGDDHDHGVDKTDFLRGADGSLAQLLLRLVEESGYEALVKSGDEYEASSRWLNLAELANMAALHKAEALGSFLDQVSLVSDVDANDGHGTLSAAGRDKQTPVLLMTVHGSKGLEFDVVFVVGVEESLMPHYRSKDDAAALREERRLLYVAMTRARHVLTLTHAAARQRWGFRQNQSASSFLEALPPSLAPRHQVGTTHSTHPYSSQHSGRHGATRGAMQGYRGVRRGRGGSNFRGGSAGAGDRRS